MESAEKIELLYKNVSNREENKLIEKKVDLDSSDFNDDCESIASSVSSNKSSKSFRSRLRKKFVFAKSNSDEVGHKALEIDLENKNLKIENVEKELDFKNKKIKDLELEKNRLLDGILEMNNEMFKLKTKLAEKEIEISQIKAQNLEHPKMAANGTNRNLDTSGTQENDDDRKIFVGGLAQEDTEKDIADYFCKFGEVASVNLKMDQMNRFRGFAFVVFVEVGTLNTVLSQDHAIKGKKLSVKKAASKQGKIFIGKIKDPTISEDVIREHFTQYGQVVEIQRPVDHNKNSEPKNFCFVTFDKEEPANALLKKGKVVVNGQELEIKKATWPVPTYNARPDGGMMMRGGMDRGGMRGGRGGCWMGGYGGGGDWGYRGGWVAEAYGPPGPWGGYGGKYSGSWGGRWFGDNVM